MQGNDVEAMKQIFAEAAFAHQVQQVNVGGRDDANVDFDCFGAAEPHELALLNHAQKFRLRLVADGGDFVEENGALIGDLEEPLF